MIERSRRDRWSGSLRRRRRRGDVCRRVASRARGCPRHGHRRGGRAVSRGSSGRRARRSGGPRRVARRSARRRSSSRRPCATSNPELVAARAAGVPVWHRSEALVRAVGAERVIAVAGAHGKTTTSAMAAHALRSCGIDASFAIGAPVLGVPAAVGGAYAGASDVAVIEADESDGSFLAYHPDVADHHERRGGPPRPLWERGGRGGRISRVRVDGHDAHRVRRRPARRRRGRRRRGRGEWRWCATGRATPTSR